MFLYGNEYSKATELCLKKAIKRNLPIEPLLKDKYDENQLNEIYLGLVKGLDVSIYGTKKLSWDKMRAIREGLEKGLDVSIYNNDTFSADKMDSIKEALLLNVYFPQYLDLNANTIRYVSKMALEGINKNYLKSFLKSGYSIDSFRELRKVYFSFGKEYLKLFIGENVRTGVISDFRKLLSSDKDLFGTRRVLNLLTAASNKSNEVMRDVRDFLLQEVSIDDCEKYVDGEISKSEMLLKVNTSLDDSLIFNYQIDIISKEIGVDIKEKYDEEQLKDCLKYNIDIKKVVDNDYSNEQLEEICYAYEDGLVDIMDKIDNTMTDIDIYVMRNKLRVSKLMRKLSKKAKVNMQELIDISYDNGFWNIDLNSIDDGNIYKEFYKNRYIDKIESKLTEIQKQLKEGLSIDEIVLLEK